MSPVQVWGCVGKLSARGIKTADIGTYYDGDGLQIIKRTKNKGKWVYRFQFHGKRRDMGLGTWPDVSLAEAREKRTEARRLVKQGIDPIREREREKLARSKIPTVKEAIMAAFSAQKAGLKKDGKNGRWLTPLELYVIPKLGQRSITDINQNDIADTIGIIWKSKNPTAKKALDRLNIAMKHAVAQGHNVDLNAISSAKVLLGPSGHITEHHASMPWQDVPDFYNWLGWSSVSRRCLSLMVLTGDAARSYPYRNMRYDEVKADIWTVPAEKMKGRVVETNDFQIPLPDPALELLDICKALNDSPWVFPNSRGNPISDVATSKLMRDNNIPYTPHGFRTTFRVWMSETDVQFQLAETAIAHKVGSDVTQAYLRTDNLKQRRVIHKEWAEYVVSKASHNRDTFLGITNDA